MAETASYPERKTTDLTRQTIYLDAIPHDMKYESVNIAETPFLGNKYEKEKKKKKEKKCCEKCQVI